jgi:hypothetical protein
MAIDAVYLSSAPTLFFQIFSCFFARFNDLVSYADSRNLKQQNSTVRLNPLLTKLAAVIFVYRKYAFFAVNATTENSYNSNDFHSQKNITFYGQDPNPLR